MFLPTFEDVHSLESSDDESNGVYFFGNWEEQLKVSFSSFKEEGEGDTYSYDENSISSIPLFSSATVSFNEKSNNNSTNCWPMDIPNKDPDLSFIENFSLLENGESGPSSSQADLTTIPSFTVKEERRKERPSGPSPVISLISKKNVASNPRTRSSPSISRHHGKSKHRRERQSSKRQKHSISSSKGSHHHRHRHRNGHNHNHTSSSSSSPSSSSSSSSSSSYDQQNYKTPPNLSADHLITLQSSTFLDSTPRRSLSSTYPRETTPNEPEFHKFREIYSMPNTRHVLRIPQSPKKMHKKRQRKTPEQLRVLEREFTKNPFPSRETRETLGKMLGLSTRQVQIWYQNKRAKAKTGEQ